MKEDLKSMSLSQMEQAFSALGEPKFRAKQVFTWLHRGARSFDEMTNLSKPLRAKLDGIYLWMCEQLFCTCSHQIPRSALSLVMDTFSDFFVILSISSI